jgi:hypothetical protein
MFGFFTGASAIAGADPTVNTTVADSATNNVRAVRFMICFLSKVPPPEGAAGMT